MRNIYLTIIVLLVFAISLVVISQKPNSDRVTNPVPGSCTIFSASVGEKVFYGNNEDYYKSKTYLWTDVATAGKYGCLYLGFEDYSHQSGINEKGLCFDANALPESKINLHLELEAPPHYEAPYDEYMIWLPVLILRKAATVNEAIEIARKYQRIIWYPENGKVKYQLNFADAEGDAVIMSVDKNGELTFTKKEQGANYLLSTNFNRANPDNALEYPCRRYIQAEEKLDGIKSEKDLSVDYFKSILQSVHQKGIFSRTLYSNIFDLQNGVVYLYYGHQFNEVVELNVSEELAKEQYVIRIKDLFSPETVKNASNELVKAIIFLCLKIITGLGSIIGLIYLFRKKITNTDVTEA